MFVLQKCILSWGNALSPLSMKISGLIVCGGGGGMSRFSDQLQLFTRRAHWGQNIFPSPGNLPNPGIKPRSPTLQVDSLPAEPQGRPKNTGVGSLSLLQPIFQTQEWKRGLRLCRRILHQLSYVGNIAHSCDLL